MFKRLLIGTALFGVSLGGSFVAGTAYGQRTALAAQAAGGARLVQGAGGPDQVVQVGPDGHGSPLAALGTISRAEGRAVYVTGSDGREVKVTLTDQTRIEKQAEGTTADLKAGTRVAVQVQGQPSSDGTVTAATITLLPDGALRWASRPPAGAEAGPSEASGSGPPTPPARGR
jgi:hypothetical protein